jgi:hypothetical protein
VRAIKIIAPDLLLTLSVALLLADFHEAAQIEGDTQILSIDRQAAVLEQANWRSRSRVRHDLAQ